MRKNLLIVTMLCLSIIGYSQTFTQNSITYNVTSTSPNTVEITNSSNYNVAVTIPSTVTHNSIAYDVTEIGLLAFYNNQLTGVVLPDTVIHIGESAFFTNQLTSIVIPDSVIEIGYQAFENNQLTNVTLGANVTTIGEEAFQANQIVSLTIPDSVTLLDDQAFFSNQIESLIIGSGLSAIGAAAFHSNQLTTITIPANITNLGTSVFTNNPLTSVTSLSITPPTIFTIPNSYSDTFGDNRSNIDLNIPAGTTGAYATDAGAQWIDFNSVTEDLEVGDTYVADFITYQVTSTTDNTVIALDYDVTGGAIVNIPATITNGLITYNVIEIEDSAFSNKGLTSVIIPNSITSIGISAFDTNSLVSVTIPDSVTIVGTTAFATNSITNLSIGDNVTIIGIGAFVDNDLTSITIPNNVTEIGLLAFANNPLTDITSLATVPPTITTGTNDTFDFNRSTIDLTIPAGTTAAYVTDAGALWTGFNSVTEDLEVGDTYLDGFITYVVTSTTDNTFEAIDYDEVNGGTAVNIPATITNGLNTYSVTTIGVSSFNSKGLTSVTFQDGLINIGQQAFINNELTTINIPNSVTTIGQGAFISNQITTIVLPDSITDVGDSAFQNNNLINVVFSSNMTSIGNNVFTTNNLSSLTIPDNITSVGIGAFQGNQLTSVTFGSAMEIIDIGAFADNQITSIVIPNTITTIGNVAFRNNPLADVYSESITPPAIITGGAADTFGEDRSNTHLHIPPGTMGDYVTDAGALWTGFNPVTEDATLSTSHFVLADDVSLVNTKDELKVISSSTVRLESYIIYSMSGAKIKEGTESTIIIDTISNGVYIIELNFERGRVTKKFIN